MATAVKTTVTELPHSRVRVEAEIPADEVQRSLEMQARKLGQEMKLPGFRQGKIPPTIVIQRLGRDPILDEAVRGQLTELVHEGDRRLRHRAGRRSRRSTSATCPTRASR